MQMPDMIESPGFPITLAFAKDKAFLSERISGILWQIEGEKFTLVHKFPILQALGHHEAGLLGIALAPDFEISGHIYAYYTYGESLQKAWNKVVRIKAGVNGEEVILDHIPGGAIHNGGILAFGQDKKLYICVGVDNEVKEKSQDKEYLGGKVLRINADGSIPADNPFPNSPVYSYGHRNLFGISFHPKTGKAYVSEAGPEKDDEINVIEKGGNYGWPQATGKQNNPDLIDPIITYTPTITPTQNCFVGNDFYFASYNEGTVHRLTFDETDPTKVISDEIVYQGRPFGLIGVFYSPEQEFFALTPNKIIKFKIEKESKNN